MTGPEPTADDLLTSWWEAQERGEGGDIEDLVARHPGLADAIRLRAAALHLLRQAFAEESLGEGEPGAGAAGLTGRTLGAYRLLAEVGVGAMGRVYRAEVRRPVGDLQAGDVVALKVVHPHLLETEGSFHRFLLEAEVGRRVSHPNVVRTLACDAIVCDGLQQNFLVMEYVEGQTLRSLLEELTVVPEDLCRPIARDLARGLAALHAAGAVHRDLKPENVLLTRDHAVKLMDLGVARLGIESARITRAGCFIGSIGYASPEQLRSAPPASDARSDLFSLGAVLYELATGRPAFPGADVAAMVARILEGVPPRPSDVNPHVSPFLDAVVQQLLQADPAMRFASAADVADVMDAGEASAWWREDAARIHRRPRGPTRRPRVPRETALHGRDAELAALLDRFDRARQGSGQVVLVEGETGVGKSRLVEEWVERLESREESPNVLIGSFLPEGGATAFGPFLSALREHLAGADLEDALLRLLPQTPALAPALAGVMRPTPAATSATLSPDAVQTGYVQVLRSLALERPTVLVLDDLHLAPHAGRRLFAALSQAVAGHRLLLLGTARDGLPSAWTAGLARVGHLTRLALARLGSEDIAHLIADALGPGPVDVDLTRRIARISDGNPYFVFEILHSLRAAGALVRSPGGAWIGNRALRELEAPSSLRTVIQARLGQLGHTERELLETASVVGHAFDPLLVAQVSGLPRLAALRHLARAERVHRLIRSVGSGCVFDSQQVQETLYEGLPPVLKRELHAGVAETLEAMSDVASKDHYDLDGALCERLATHFLHGGQGTRALRYLRAGIDHLASGHAHAAAIALMDRALGCPGLLVGAARARILLKKFAAHDLREERAAQETILAEVRSLEEDAADPGLSVELEFVAGHLMWRTGRSEEARTHLLLARDRCRDAGNALGEARAEIDLGSACWSLGRLAEAQAHLERALVLGRQLADRPTVAKATNNLGTLFWTLGRHEDALVHHQRASELHAELGDRLREANAHAGTGLVLMTVNRFDEAEASLARALAMFQEVGSLEGEARVTGNLGNLCWHRGRLADARRYYERALALAAEGPNRFSEAQLTGNLGGLLQVLGRTEDSSIHHARALALAREIGHDVLACHLVHQTGVVADQAGDAEGAERLYGEALEQARASGNRMVQANALVSLAEVCRTRGAASRASVLLEQAAGLYRGLQQPGGELSVACLQACLDRAAIPAALALFDETRERLSVGEAMSARLLLWTATGERIHLVEARRSLDRMLEGASPECRVSMRREVHQHRRILAASDGEGSGPCAASARAM